MTREQVSGAAADISYTGHCPFCGWQATSTALTPIQDEPYAWEAAWKHADASHQDITPDVRTLGVLFHGLYVYGTR
jgi:hypothetical protein